MSSQASVTACVCSRCAKALYLTVSKTHCEVTTFLLSHYYVVTAPSDTCESTVLPRAIIHHLTLPPLHT